jgi:hypothetical protein
VSRGQGEVALPGLSIRGHPNPIAPTNSIRVLPEIICLICGQLIVFDGLFVISHNSDLILEAVPIAELSAAISLIRGQHIILEGFGQILRKPDTRSQTTGIVMLRLAVSLIR